MKMKIEEPAMQEMMRGVKDVDDEEEEPQEVKQVATRFCKISRLKTGWGELQQNDFLQFFFFKVLSKMIRHRSLAAGSVAGRLLRQATSTVR